MRLEKKTTKQKEKGDCTAIPTKSVMRTALLFPSY